MKTILKFVAYLEIESENLDRKILSSSVQTLLFPEVIRFLAKEARPKDDIVEKISKTCLGRINSIKFIQTQELFKPRLKEVVLDKNKKSFEELHKEILNKLNSRK